jgi:PAS domain S-box-containing protein
MKFTIKSKLSLGMIFIYANVLALALLSNFYVFRLSSDSEAILRDNYKTLQYCNNMLMALDEVKSNHEALKNLEANLQKQEKNITEPGEKELTEQIRIPFEKLKTNLADSSLYEKIRLPLYQVSKLNQTAMELKNRKAIKTAETAKIWIGILSGILLILMFTFVINFPGYIADPIKTLTEGIKEIAANNYSQRIHLKSTDEFGELAEAFNSMAVTLEFYNNSNLSKLLFEKKRIDTLINKMHDPVIGLDENKIVLFANEEAFKVTGLKQEEIIGKNAKDVALTNDLIRYLMQDVVASEGAYKKIAAKPLKIFADNKESYFDKEIIDITITPTGEQTPKHIGYVIVLRNITPFKELDFAKTNFIATISHELKTPISAIKAGLQLLENKKTGAINEEQKQLIESIKDDSNRLLKIIGELLNLSQVETGNIQLSIQQSDPSKILQYALEAVKVQADQKGIKLEVKTDEKLPLVKADVEKTAWVLINFLTNAIRYSPEKREVIIEVKKDADKVLFSVRDFGKGIESKYKDKIFTRYFQVPGSSKHGTGLGLSISKEFIEAQGGEIKMESEIGDGSKFIFSLNA